MRVHEIVTRLFEQLGDGIIAYHGGPVRIDRFQPLSHFGSFRAAKQRAVSRRSETSFIHQVRLHIKNPLRVSDAAASEEASFLSAVLKGDHPEIDAALLRGEGAVEALRAAGYDGLVYRNEMEDRGRLSYVALSPEQVEIIDVVEIPRARS